MKSTAWAPPLPTRNQCRGLRGTGGADLALHQVPEHIAAEITIESPPRWRDDTTYKICFETDDLAALRGAIIEHGGQAKEPWSWEGTDFCECTDPEGNVVQTLSRQARADD
jgi:hypothetical protein